MNSAKRLVRAGNILQTIWFVILVVMILMNTGFKAIGAIPAYVSTGGGIPYAIFLVVLCMLCWMAGNHLENRTWRILLVIFGVFALMSASSLIAAILFFLGAYRAGKAALD